MGLGKKQEIENEENHLLGQQLLDQNVSGEIQKKIKINLKNLGRRANTLFKFLLLGPGTK